MSPRRRSGGTHAPLRLESRLDDNYQTRMLCGYDASLGLPGNDAFGLDAPVSAAHLRCAMRHLYHDYSLVGVTHRYDEYVCVICEVGRRSNLLLSTAALTLPRELCRVNPAAHVCRHCRQY